MRIFVPKETAAGEKRVPLVPEAAKRLAGLGAEVAVQSGIGVSIHRGDAEYERAGARVIADRTRGLRDADMVLRLRKPPTDEVACLREGCIHISHLDPFNERELVERLAAAKVSAISMEMIPRSTLAQKMDALSSQANLAGYLAVILAAEELDRIFPMMMTPAGTIQPARAFVIGAGVAGLQAIATARRLGARVEAFDTRPAVEEQVRSLGARFVKVDLGETGQTEQGYAKALTEQQLTTQREVMAKHCALADV
ncbi:MAG: NAD(P)(+) transhydrogenase (Re/Si-specific) subunit alpha, partial [Verrucomicrobia bacterium]